jgi:hypothetical protein
MDITITQPEIVQCVFAHLLLFILLSGIGFLCATLTGFSVDDEQPIFALFFFVLCFFFICGAYGQISGMVHPTSHIVAEKTAELKKAKTSLKPGEKPKDTQTITVHVDLEESK